VLKPVQIAGQLLGDITFASSRKTDHDDDKLSTDIALGDSAIWGDLGLGQARDIKGSSSNSAGCTSGLFLAQTAGTTLLAPVREAQDEARR
jgi:hypothetical protein